MDRPEQEFAAELAPGEEAFASALRRGVAGAASIDPSQELILARYLDGGLSSEERAELEHRLVREAGLRDALVKLANETQTIMGTLPHETMVEKHLEHRIVPASFAEKINKTSEAGLDTETEAIALQEFTKLRAQGGGGGRQ